MLVARTAAITGTSPPRSTGRVLLTGATGFLGAHLVAALVASDVHIDCLVRAEDPAHAERRLCAAPTGAGVYTDALAARITTIPGDLARPLLGLDDATFAALADRVDEIFHAGALVDLLRPYASMRASNVGGTYEVLRLATTGAVKPVRHVSTVAVGVAREADDPRHPRRTRTTPCGPRRTLIVSWSVLRPRSERRGWRLRVGPGVRHPCREHRRR